MEHDLNTLLERLRQAEQRASQAEQRVEPSTLLGLLEGCHELSLAIRVEVDATLTTQGDPTNPVNRLRPKRLVPWEGFPASQEAIWEAFDNEGPGFSTHRAFATKDQLDLIRHGILPIRSELHLQYFQRDTVDRFVNSILKEIHKNDRLRRRFKLHGHLSFEDNNNAADMTSPLETSMQQLRIADSVQHVPSTRGRARSAQRPIHRRRRNRRADQFCVHVISDDQRVPVYAVEHKAPHKLSLAEILAGLHEMDLEKDVINTDGDSFEYHATRLVAAVITQLFSYMVDVGVQHGYICTGEAFICLRITEDPSVVQYYLLVPNRDVTDGDELRLHRTAVAQILAFTLNAVQADRPSQAWYDAADNLDTWEVEYLDILKQIPESVRKEPPSFVYKPPSWKPMDRSPYMLRRRCQPDFQPSRKSQRTGDKDGHGDEAGASSSPPSPSPPPNNASRRARGDRGRGRGRGRRGRGLESQEASGCRPKGAENPKNAIQDQYCTMKCLRGLAKKGPLDPQCPNVKRHGHLVHKINARDLTRLLSDQLSRDREIGFEQLHIVGRTGFLLKATLLSHGYTVVLKATNAEQLPSLGQEIEAYHHLRSLQGTHVPVCWGISLRAFGTGTTAT
ncbi:metalloprotease m41 ftsh [Aspergillus luchuensis IFO 4308]|nr:metalloprotease m41 ftsh [Aspergillus luchuensis IFO 4308]